MLKSGDNNTNSPNMNSTVLPNNCKIILQQNIPIEDLLGSVTTYNNIEGSDSSKSLQLRTSARVFKKMKLDSANAAISVTTPIPEKKEPVKEEAKQEVKKGCRPLWLQEDKNLFFEALNEFGKDFEAIHSYISNKLKKKAVPENLIKTKEQIRHLYYRTWHKISKHLRFSEEVKKIAQELYGLINFGELRKRLSIISEKTCIKLNELIYRGCVAIRVKGKTIRIKTPMCKALRKLNQLDERENDLKLPARVTVELMPKDMNTWLHIQNMSQNPRVRTLLPLQKRLSSLLMCMMDRWKTQGATEFEKSLQSVKDVLNSDNQVMQEIEEENKFIKDPPLRFTPPKGCNIEVPTINLSEYLTSQSICLNAYEERFGVKNPGEQIWLNSCANKGGSRKCAIKRSRHESNSEKTSPTNKINTTPTTTTTTTVTTTIDNNENCVTGDLSSSVREVIDEAVSTLLALQLQPQNQIDGGKAGGSSDEKLENPEIKLEIVEQENALDSKNNMEIVRNGWTLSDCGTLSIGDLYLMFGSDAKLPLEYSWDEEEIKKECTEVIEKDNKENVGSPDDIDGENLDSKESLIKNPNSLSVTLKRLLTVAKLHYRKNRIQCPCGHVCGTTAKQNKNKNMPKNLTVNTSKEKFYNNQEKPVSVQQQGEVLMIQSLNSEQHITHIRRLSPSILFRRPTSPNDILRAQLDSIQRLKPRYCNRRGRRPRNKPVVVERKLPILANKAENGRQIVQMSIISQDNIPSTTQTQRPILPKIHYDDNTPGINQDINPEQDVVYSTLSTNEISQKIAISNGDTINISDNATTPSRVGSPTSISNLLQMALTTEGVGEVMQTSEIKEDGSISFVGLLTQNISASTPPSSPSRILKENENQWLNSEVADFSLSSFLGHLDSPMKPSQSSGNIVNDDTRLSLASDVDAHLQSLLNETSLDYTAKFADLAAQVTKK